MKRILIKLLLCSLILVSTQAWAQSLQISGKVIDNLDEGIPGATIKIKGSKEGAITDIDGNYHISVLSTGNPVLVFSFMGYKTQEVPVNKRKVINVTLAESSVMIDDVVILGFGSQPKVNVSGSVASVDAKVLASRPITNAVSGLQGAVAGLNITNDLGGAPGQKMNINIRGVGSIGEGSNSKALVLIDGMEGDLSTINPADIATISVLKDAASASIYGSRAPNGVILITTKTGEKGFSVTYGGNIRIQQPISVPEMVDSYRYALFSNEAKSNSNLPARYGDDKLKRILAYQNGTSAPGDEFGIKANEQGTAWLGNEDCWGSTDWNKVHMKNHAVSQEHNLNMSGGTEKYNYYISARYMNQLGLFRYADDKFENLSINGNFTIKVNKYVSFNWNTRFINEDSQKPSGLGDLFFHNLGRMVPFSPLTNPNGEYSSTSCITNLLDGGLVKRNTQYLYNQGKLTVTPLKGWNINLDIANRLETPNDSRQYKKIYLTEPNGIRSAQSIFQAVTPSVPEANDQGEFALFPAAGTSWYEKGNGSLNYYNANLRSDYEFKLGDHTFKVLGGMQLEYEHFERGRLGTTDVIAEETPYIKDTPKDLYGSEKRGTWSTLGFFSRLNYNYANRYMLEANFRADGASRFPPHKRWGYFPSFSAAWNVAQEPFFEQLRESWFDTFKFRGSYGSLGNQNTSSYYPYFQKVGLGSADYIINGANGNQILAPKPYSSDITWETLETVNVGLDLAFLQNRLTVNADWFQRTTLNMIGPAKSMPSIFGVLPPLTNNAELRTRGWELEFTWRDRIGKDWSYEVSASLSDMEQVITRYDSATGELNKYYKGKNLGDIWGLQVIGIAQCDEEMDNHLATTDQSNFSNHWGGGDFMFRNLDDDPRITEGKTLDNPGDLSVIGNKTPHYSYGIRANLTWKFLDFSMFWQGVGKRDYYFDKETFLGITGEWWRSVSEDHMDYFRYADNPLGANLNSYYARPREDGANNKCNDYYLQDASYLRLKNVTVGASLPKNLKISKYIKNLRLYVSAENLLTFTNLMIFDPEAIGSEEAGWGVGKTYPMYRTISVGLSATF